MHQPPHRTLTILILACCVATTSCRRKDTGASHAISIKGSDTLVQVATAWAERYSEMGKGVSVNASGGGSGTGIACLIDGIAQVFANPQPFAYRLFEPPRKRMLQRNPMMKNTLS